MGQTIRGRDGAGDNFARGRVPAEGVYRDAHWRAPVGTRLDVFYGDRGTALVVAALAAYPVRHVRLAAVGTGHEARASKGVVRPALVSARPRRLLLWNGHQSTSWLLLAYGLEPRDVEVVEAPPARVDLVRIVLGLHWFRARREDLHRDLGGEGTLGVARQVEGPVLHGELGIVRP